MKLFQRRIGRAALALLGLAAVACGPRIEDHPITQQAQPFGSMNDTVNGQAPPVAEGVTFQRLR